MVRKKSVPVSLSGEIIMCISLTKKTQPNIFGLFKSPEAQTVLGVNGIREYLNKTRWYTCPKFLNLFSKTPGWYPSFLIPSTYFFFNVLKSVYLWWRFGPLKCDWCISRKIQKLYWFLLNTYRIIEPII